MQNDQPLRIQTEMQIYTIYIINFMPVGRSVGALGSDRAERRSSGGGCRISADFIGQFASAILDQHLADACDHPVTVL